MTFNIFAARRRYRVTCLQGELRWHGSWLAETEERAFAEVGAGGGAWEVALEEYESTLERRPYRSFDVCLSEAQHQLDTFTSSLSAAPPDLQEARQLAAYVLWASTIAPEGLLRRPGVLMSKNWMSNVWSWDHCFNALALAPGAPCARLGPALADERLSRRVRCVSG